MASEITTFDTSFDTSEGRRAQRMDVVPAGPARRRWSAEAKARIIGESFAPGANVAAIARAYDLAPQQLYNWRGAILKEGGMSFVPAVVDSSDGTLPLGSASEIVIRTGAVTIRVPESVSTDHIARVLVAARQAA